MSEQSRRKQGGFVHTLVRARDGKAGRQNQIRGSLPAVNATRRARKSNRQGATAPPFHVFCRSTTVPYFSEDFGGIGRRAARDDGGTYYMPANMTYREWEKTFVEGGDKKGLRELFRRKSKDGQEIIDKTTYNKLTKDFLKRSGIIIRGEESEKHLEKLKAYASYMPGANAAFIRYDATVSDVLEEMYHAEQERKHIFGEAVDERIIYLREIDAQKYLLNMAEKYKIPLAEQNATREALEHYERKLPELDGE